MDTLDDVDHMHASALGTLSCEGDADEWEAMRMLDAADGAHPTAATTPTPTPTPTPAPVSASQRRRAILGGASAPAATKRARSPASPSPAAPAAAAAAAASPSDPLAHTRPLARPRLAQTAAPGPARAPRLGSAAGGSDLWATSSDDGYRVWLDWCVPPSQWDEEHASAHAKPGQGETVPPLLGVPFARIQRDAQQLMRESARRAEACASDAPPGPSSDVEESLWVDKWAPATYRELLSDERINRELLTWLRQWQDCVTQHAARSRQDEPDGAGADASQPNKDMRPERRIALLAGPPGLGKTTLAHVLARMAGFRTLEVNASDDRSRKTLSNRVFEAVSTHSVHGQHQPCCVIVDEIDGTGHAEGKAAITALVGLGADKAPTRVDNWKLRRPIICVCNDLYSSSLFRLRQSARVFRFPAIRTADLVSRLQVICQGEGMRVDKHTLHHLCERTGNDVRATLNTLQFIRKQSTHLRLDHLTSMQFGVSDGTSSIFDVWDTVFRNVKSGHARTKSLLAKRMQHDAAFVAKMDANMDMDLVRSTQARLAELQYVHDVVCAANDVDRVVDGVWHNHLHPSVAADASMFRSAALMEWFVFADHLQTVVMRKQSFALKAYVPWAAVATHIACRSHRRPVLSMPPKPIRSVLRARRQVLAACMERMRPRALSAVALNPTLVVTQVLSPLLRILSPPTLDKVVTSEEREALALLASLYTAHGLSLTRNDAQRRPWEAVDPTAPAFSLHPPVDIFVRMGATDDASDRRKASSSARSGAWSRRQQSDPGGASEPAAVPPPFPRLPTPVCERLAAAMLEQAAIGFRPPTRTSPVPAAATTSTGPPQQSTVVHGTHARASGGAGEAAPAAEPIVPSRLVLRDFFGRPIERPEAPGAGAERDAGEGGDVPGDDADVDMVAAEGCGGGNVTYVFQEGYSNAVRRTVYVRDFL